MNTRGKIFENAVLHSFLFHFKYDFKSSIPTVIISIAIFYLNIPRHNCGEWGWGATIYN